MGKRKHPEGMEHLDEKGRCCGRKPLIYKREGEYFCPRCDRSFDIVTRKQKPNFAWAENQDGSFERYAGPAESSGVKLVEVKNGTD